METLILIVYFGMMPVLTIAAMVIHKLGYADMVEELGGEKIGFGYPIMMALWPICVFAGVFVGIVFVVLWVSFMILNAFADFIVNTVKGNK